MSLTVHLPQCMPFAIFSRMCSVLSRHACICPLNRVMLMISEQYLWRRWPHGNEADADDINYTGMVSDYTDMLTQMLFKTTAQLWLTKGYDPK